MEADTRLLTRLLMTAWLLSLLLCHLVLSAPLEQLQGSPPEWKQQFFVSQRSAIVNTSMKIFCKVKGTPRPFIEWFKNGEALADGKRIRITKYALEVMNTQLSDAGEYACRAHNQHGVLWGNMTLRVLKEMDDATPPFEYDDKDDSDPFSSVASEPVWSKSKDRATYISGSATKTVELDCDVRGYPEPNITWYKVDGRKPALLDLTKSKYVPNNRWKLKIDDLALEDNGQYMCIVANSYGAINWTFTVEVLQRLPLAPIVDEIENQTAIEGETVRFTCKIILSDSQPFLQWFQHYKINDSYVNENGTPNVKLLQQSGYMKTIDDPQNLVLRNVTRKDEGWYTCLVTNTIGMNYKSAYLTVMTAEEAEALQNKNITASPHSSHSLHGVHDQMPPKTIILICVCCGAVFLFIFITAMVCKCRQKPMYKYADVKRVIVMRSNDLYYPDQPGMSVEPIQFPEIRIEGTGRRRRFSSAMTMASEYELPLDSKWEFPRDRLTLGKELGSGAFGVVREGRAIGIGNRQGPSTVAVKMLKQDATDREMTDLMVEMEMMKIVRGHKNIISLLGCCTQNGPLYVITEFAPNGNLRDYLRTRRPGSENEKPLIMDYEKPLIHEKPLSEKDLISYAYQIARGMEYLASRM
ncbi:hypothetical protein DPMN_164387, partial [Dreissena polymorpha]